jgi:hypothetical protein
MATEETAREPNSVTRRRFLTTTAGAVVGGTAALALVGPATTAGEGRRERPEDFDAGVATAWFDLSRTLARTTPGFTPPVVSRALAYAGVALYEALAPGSRQYRSLERELPGLRLRDRTDRGLHWPTVANSTLAAMMRLLFPTTGDANKAAIDDLEASFADRSRRRTMQSAFTRSDAHGRSVARSVFGWSRRDGGHEAYLRNFPGDYVPPVGPGLWVPTPPSFQSALQPSWGRNRCFAIASGSACPPGPPTTFSEDSSSGFFAEAVEVYDAVNNRTPEQEAIALFWSDDPGVTSTPPGHSISIATQVIRLERASLMVAAETYAKVGMAVADAFISCWHAKYRYNLLRPVTYIRALVDSGWLPVLNTPPFPEHTSGHSVQSGAAFQVLADLFGDRYSFDDHTHDGRGLAPRHFDSFSQCADEAAISRLYGGIHFRPAIDQGLEQGRCVGRAVSGLPFRGGHHRRHEGGSLTG